MSKPRIDSIRIVVEDDESPDTSYLGVYQDEEQDGVIVVEEGRFLSDLQAEDPEYSPPERGRDYRFFLPVAGDEKPGTKEYAEYGMQDFEHMQGLNRGDWAYVGVWAEATVSYPVGNRGDRRLEVLRSGGLWGIESDSKEYIKETAKDELADLKEHLQKFGVSTEEFDELSAAALEEYYRN
jgi:hypothetical protein